jgi:hypothetical protein
VIEYPDPPGMVSEAAPELRRIMVPWLGSIELFDEMMDEKVGRSHVRFLLEHHLISHSN